MDSTIGFYHNEHENRRIINKMQIAVARAVTYSRMPYVNFIYLITWNNLYVLTVTVTLIYKVAATVQPDAKQVITYLVGKLSKLITLFYLL